MQTRALLSSPCLYPIQKLPISQACGVILGYEVKLFDNNSTLKLVNVSTAESCGQLFDEMKCLFNSSLKGVSSVSVSAFNAHGATVPSHLDMQTPGMSCPDCHKSKEGFVSV